MDDAEKRVDRVQIYQGLLDRSREVGAKTVGGVNEFVLNSDNKRFDAGAATTRLARGVDLGSEHGWSDFGQFLATMNVSQEDMISLFTRELGVVVDLDAKVNDGKLLAQISDLVLQVYDELGLDLNEEAKGQWTTKTLSGFADKVKQIEENLPQDSGDYRLGIYFTAGALGEGPDIHCVQMPRYLKDEKDIPKFVQRVFGVTSFPVFAMRAELPESEGGFLAKLFQRSPK